MEKKAKTDVPKDDRISELPQVILQHIQYYLSPKQAAQTTTLSKPWRNTWSNNRPNVDLSQFSFQGTKHEILSLLNDTLQGYHDHKLRIMEFRLRLSLSEIHSESELTFLDKWIPIVMHMGVKKLRLKTYLRTIPYYLSAADFEEQYLIELSLRGFRLNHDMVIMFKHLKVLQLYHVDIQEKTFERIISSCLLIENLKVKECEGLKNIKVNNVRNLKTVYFWSYDTDPMVECRGTNLESITISAFRSNWFHVHKFEVFLNLKYLSLTGVDLFGISQYTFSFCPRLETLKIFDCYEFEEFKIFNDSIKHISLTEIKGRMKADVNAPNILSFEYQGYVTPTLSFAKTNSKWKSNICLDFPSSSSCLNKLLKELSQSEISLKFRDIDLSYQADNIVHSFEPVEVELLHFCIRRKKLSTAFVDDLFFVCHPRNVEVNWHGKENDERNRKNNDLAEYICKILMETRESSIASQELITRLTWQKDLKEVSLKRLYDETLHEWRPLHYETSLRKCALLNDDKCLLQIRLELKWTKYV